MMKDNQTVSFSVYNLTENATSVENCFVTELDFGSYDPDVLALKLSENITPVSYTHLEVLDYLDGDEAGVKSVTFQVNGENAYGYLKSEKGVHLSRIHIFRKCWLAQELF